LDGLSFACGDLFPMRRSGRVGRGILRVADQPLVIECCTPASRASFSQVVQSGQEVAAARQLRDNEVVADAITQDPEVMHGIPVFRGTRVPVQTMFEYLEGGETLEDFLAGFPTVPRSVALEALGEARRLLLARAS
jgi:uncharacterized protein (DUF433 family)